MNAQTDPLQINPSEELIRLGPLGVRFLIAGDRGNGSIALFELTVPGTVGLSAPAHSHDRYEETIYGIEGALTWTVEGKAIEVGPGQALCIPRGAVHRFDNLGGVDAKALCVITPAELGPQYFHDIVDVMKAAGGGPPDKVRLGEVMRRHGLTPVVAP